MTRQSRHRRDARDAWEHTRGMLRIYRDLAGIVMLAALMEAAGAYQSGRVWWTEHVKRNPDEARRLRIEMRAV